MKERKQDTRNEGRGEGNTKIGRDGHAIVENGLEDQRRTTDEEESPEMGR